MVSVLPSRRMIRASRGKGTRLLRTPKPKEHRMPAEAIRAAIGDGAVFSLRPADEKYFSALKEYCAELRTDRTVLLGGIRAENRDTGG